MKLTQGDRLGPYEVVSLLGAGGMGEVYRAKDLRLERTVALKILKNDESGGSDTEGRFKTEARAISQLQHANICTLFDLGRHGSTDYLVMEYLEGEPLSRRIERGPLPLDQVLRFAHEMASALHMAHRRHIVHRDLKPGNIMLTGSGAKLLDFGLAKFRRGTKTDFLTTESATDLSLTADGALLGTLPYMAPELFHGSDADERSDIWALGCILYEMVSGSRAFAGPSQVIVQAILHSEPPPVSTYQTVSPALEHLIATCLIKDPERRWQNARDIELQLESISRAGNSNISAQAVPARMFPLRLAMVVAVICALAVAAFWLVRNTGNHASNPEVRFEFTPPPGWQLFKQPIVEFIGMAVSPDGSRIAFVATESSTGQSKIWMRGVSEFSASPVAGTDGANSLFWSTDGKSIGFFSQGKLKRVDPGTGSVISLCDVLAVAGYSASWGSKGHIVFGSASGQEIFEVSSEGGEPKLVAKPDKSSGERFLHWPIYLPDGESFLCISRKEDSSRALVLFEPGRPPRQIAQIASRVEFLTPETLVYVKEGALLAQKFDSKRRELTGAPVSMAPSIRYFLSTAWAGFAAANGTLIYSTRNDSNYMIWSDRNGNTHRYSLPPGKYLSFALSPDGRKLLFDRARPDLGTYDLWTFDFEREVETRLTSGLDNEVYGLWLPDGQGIVYSAVLAGAPELMRKNLRTGEETVLAPQNTFQVATDVSRDGKTLLYRQRGQSGKWDAWTLSLTGPANPTRLILSQGSETDYARYSPDGRFVAFVSNESGSPEAYLAPIASPGERVRVSREGASGLEWSYDGREILYLSRDGSLISQPVQLEPALRLGSPVTLLTSKITASWVAYRLAPDGQRLVAIVNESSGGQPVNAIVGWTAR